MGLTQLQKLELNKRVDKIFHAPSNAAVRGCQPEIAFVADMTGDAEFIYSSIKDAVTSLKAHDKMFQNMRSNMVYWKGKDIVSEVTPMSFILMHTGFQSEIVSRLTDTKSIFYDQSGDKLFENGGKVGDIVDKNVDNLPVLEKLCEYLKLYQARSRCILIFTDCIYEVLEEQHFYVKNKAAALANLNPFLKYRLLMITKDKMVNGMELFMKVVNFDAE